MREILFLGERAVGPVEKPVYWPGMLQRSAFSMPERERLCSLLPAELRQTMPCSVNYANLCAPHPLSGYWTPSEGRQAARGVEEWCSNVWEGCSLLICCCGSRVAHAVAMRTWCPLYPMRLGAILRTATYGVYLTRVPHPNVRNRQWNEQPDGTCPTIDACRVRLREQLIDLGYLPECKIDV